MRDLLLVSAVILSSAALFVSASNHTQFGAAVNISATGTSTLPNGLNLTTGCLTRGGGVCIGGSLNGYTATSSAMGNKYDGGTPALGTMTAYCPSGQYAISAYYTLNSNNDYVYSVTRTAVDQWTLLANANNNGDTSAVGSMGVICITP